jgi:predicted amidohydrolase
MILAIAPIELHPFTRSENLGRLVAAVVQAANLDPAPDLIVLPYCAPSAISLPDAPLSESMSQTFAETFSALAREWGVWLAMGVATGPADAPEASAMLFDPDGDTVIPVRGAPAGPKWVVQPTALGVLAMNADAGPPGDWELPKRYGKIDLAIALSAPAAGASSGQALAAAAGRQDCYLAVVPDTLREPGSRAHRGAATVIDRVGHVLASGVAGHGGIIAAALTITPAPVTTRLTLEPPALE